MSMRKILALLLAVVMVCSLFVSPALAAEDAGEPVAISDSAAPKFTDVDGHWAESAIVRWAEAGIIEGDGDGTVQPARSLKRAELATILARLLGLKATAPADTFSDVAANAWYADAVLKCAEAGIMLGDGTGKANPEAAIDRQQTIVMVGRALGVKPTTGHSLDRFDDGDTVADWAAPYMIALTDMGILNGLPTGEGDGAIVAPTVNIDRASTFTLLDKAIAQYITAPCTVTVSDADKFVVINSAAEEKGVVTVTGSTAGVVIATGTTDDVVLNRASVGTLKVDAPVNVTINRGSSVTDLDANAAADVTNNGVVTNLNTNADDVTFDGNKPAKVNTAEGVEPAKDSKGNEVTSQPTSSGSTGGSSSTSYKYTVSIASAVGGKVTADVTRTNTANTEVTLTVTPNGGALPYVLKSLTVKNGETEVTVNNNKFTMDTEGTYTVTAEFAQPITKAEMFIAKDADGLAKMLEYGYPENDVTAEQLAETPYLFIGLEHNKTDFEDASAIKENTTLTANGANVSALSSQGWYNSLGKYSTSYVNTKHSDDPHDPADALGLEGSAYTFVLTFDYKGVTYELTCDYVKPGVDESTLRTVTFKTSTGKEIASYKAAENEKVTVPAAPAIDGYYFTGWSDSLTNGAEYTVGNVDATITAEYKQVGKQELKTRPNGPANDGTADFDYAAAYEAAGVTFTGTPGNYTYTIDGKAFLNYAAQEENNLEKLAATVGDKTYYFYGAAIMAEVNAAKLVLTKDAALSSLDNSEKYSEFDLATSEHKFTIDGKDCILQYFGAVAAKDAEGVYGFQPDGKFVRYAKWVDSEGNVLAVNEIVLNRKTELSQFTVTFKADGKTVDAVKVDYNTAIGELPEVPAKAGYTGAWKDVTAETKIVADTTVEATYTAIEYTIHYDGVAENTKMTVESEDNLTLKAAPADDKAHEGYTFAGWQILTACNEGDEGAVEDTNDSGKWYKWVDVEGEIAPADLPKKAVGKDANCIHFQSKWTANSEATFEAMTTEVYDLYKGDKDFGVNIPALDEFQKDVTFKAGEAAGTIIVEGELLPITNPAYAGFNGVNEKEQTGYYLVFQFEAPVGTKDSVSGNIVTTAKKSFTTAALDKVGDKEIFSFIWWLAEPATEANATLEGKTIELTIDWDGDGEKTGTKYTLDLSAVTLKATETTAPDQGDAETADLSAVEVEEVAAPVEFIVPSDDEVAEIPVMD